ncbi:D(1)-like dopamine receptor [Dendronephthya gigantea]|uniref:D(1)-like dopamine receptor n=1 Tax=Dendronephthya gigantea TaxID=151771 RepID=UPI00106A5B71|nr:D(1)-like dopamine receptor [Dendronephthya gigantea]
MDSNLTNQTNATVPTEPEDVANLGKILWFFQVIFLFFIIFAALAGNLLVLTATYLDKRLHNANKYFVATLAVSDLLVAMFSVTMRLHLFLNENKMTLVFCRFWIWVDIFTEAASITTLTIICIDRYYKVSRPFRYKSNVTTSRACRIIAFIWIYSAVLGALGLVPYPGNKGVHITTNVCQNENRTFYTLAALLGFFIPVGILIILCTLIFRIVQAHSRNRLPSQECNEDSARIHQRKQTHSNRRSLLTLTLIVLTFIMCWGPFFILFVIFQHNPALLGSMGLYGFMILQTICFGVLPYCNSFLNPIIYAFFDKTFNIAIKAMLLKLCKGQKSYSVYRSSTVRITRPEAAKTLV